MKRFIFLIVLAAIFSSCATTEVTTEQRTSTYIYRTKTGLYRVTNTFTRKVDTLSQPVSIIKRIRMVEK